MDVRNCKICRGLFNYVSGPAICPTCREKREQKFQEVKAYVRDHPGIRVPQLAEACEVSVDEIRQWLREERLEMTDDSMFLNCESCGTPIRSGRYCDKCKNNLANGFGDLLNQRKPAPSEPAKRRDSSSKMRFL